MLKYILLGQARDPDLITIKAGKILEKADVIVYAGSLVPEGLVRRFAKKRGTDNRFCTP